jgi:hypothetical protein
MYELECHTETLIVTMCPPLPVQWGEGWWVRVDDVWIKARQRSFGETWSPQLADELRLRI